MTTFQILGNLGEFIGALGVVTSLVYLAQQMSKHVAYISFAQQQLLVRSPGPGTGSTPCCRWG